MWAEHQELSTDLEVDMRSGVEGLVQEMVDGKVVSRASIVDS